MFTTFSDLTAVLAARAQDYDASGQWPVDSLEAFGRADGWRWSVDRDYGGDRLTSVDQLQAYEALARGDVSVALIITQRDAAIDLILQGDNDALKRELLPRYAAGEAFTTVGISQLTTSHRQGPPAMTVRQEGDAVILDGFMPWATGADHSDEIVTGGVLDSGLELLVSVPTNSPGLIVEPPAPLMALESSHTSRVRCQGVRVDRSRVIRGPRENVVARRSPVKNWVTSSVGLGLAAAMLDQIDACRPTTGHDLLGLCDRLRDRRDAVRARLMTFAGAGGDVDKAEVDAVRVEINDLLVRLAGVMMTVTKGSGYLKTHPAQRLAREALFFCVWSAPEPIRHGTVGRLVSWSPDLDPQR